MRTLYEEMESSLAAIYEVVGYFDVTPNDTFSSQCRYLGNPDNFADFMSGKTSVKHVFCSLAMDEGHYNVPIINYCENHLLYFHGVPNVCKGFPQPVSYTHLHGTTWGEYSGCNSRPTNVTIQIYARLFGRNDLYEHIAISAGRKNTCNKGAIGRTGRGTGRYEWEIKSRRPTDNVGMCVCRYTGRMCGAGLVLSIEFKNSD